MTRGAYFGPAPAVGGEDPVIVTAVMDAAAQDRFEAARRAWFPASRNRVPAHLSLFHRLPGEHAVRIAADAADICAGFAPLAAVAARVRFLGRGFAIDLDAPGLVALHRGLSHRWARWLTLQDRQAFKPHVTVQNKADPAAARRDCAAFQADFAPFTVTVEAVALWRYRGGPWDAAGQIPLGRGTNPAE